MFIWVYLGLFRAYSCLFGFIWAYLGLFGFIWAYLGLFGFIWVYLIICVYLGLSSVPLINEFVPSGFNPGSCMYICVSVWIYIYIYD